MQSHDTLCWWEYRRGPYFSFLFSRSLSSTFRFAAWTQASISIDIETMKFSCIPASAVSLGQCRKTQCQGSSDELSRLAPRSLARRMPSSIGFTSLLLVLGSTVSCLLVSPSSLSFAKSCCHKVRSSGFFSTPWRRRASFLQLMEPPSASRCRFAFSFAA